MIPFGMIAVKSFEESNYGSPLFLFIVYGCPILLAFAVYYYYSKKRQEYESIQETKKEECEHSYVEGDFKYECSKCGKTEMKSTKSVEKIKSSGLPYEMFAKFSHYGLQAGGTLAKIEIGDSGLEIKQRGKSKEFVSYSTISNVTRKSDHHINYRTNTSTVWQGYIGFDNKQKTDFAVKAIKKAMSGKINRGSDKGTSGKAEEIEKYYDLMKKGAISEEEYEEKKEDILND